MEMKTEVAIDYNSLSAVIIICNTTYILDIIIK